MLQHSLAVDHCRDCDLICFSDVDNAVAIGNQLTDVFFVEFRNLAAGSGEASQFSRRGHNCSNDGRRISRRIDGDISGNGFDIGEGSWRPRLLCKPLAQPLLYVVLRECPIFGVFEAVSYFVEDVEVVLDVLNGAVFWEFIQKGFDLLFGVGHRGLDG